MESKDMRSQNDNMAEWREKRKKATEILLQKAICELEKIQANINQKNTSEMMDKLASDKDKEYKANIKPSAISKNKVLKAMIQEAQAKRNAKVNQDTLYSLDAESQYDIFKLKSIIAKKDAKIKEYENIFQRANLTSEKSFHAGVPSDTYKLILEELTKICINDGLLYFDENEKNIIHENDGRIVIPENILQNLKYNCEQR